MDNAKGFDLMKALGSRSSRSNKSKKKSSKAITISDDEPIVHFIERVDELSSDERSQIWLTQGDYREIKSSSFETVAMMNIAEALDSSCDSSVCTRGLESRTYEGSRLRRKIHRTAIFVVLDEQDRQRVEGEENVEALADIARQSSYPSRKSASEIGREDEKAVCNYLGREVADQSRDDLDAKPTFETVTKSILPPRRLRLTMFQRTRAFVEANASN